MTDDELTRRNRHLADWITRLDDVLFGLVESGGITYAHVAFKRLSAIRDEMTAAWKDGQPVRVIPPLEVRDRPKVPLLKCPTCGAFMRLEEGDRHICETTGRRSAALARLVEHIYASGQAVRPSGNSAPSCVEPS